MSKKTAAPAKKPAAKSNSIVKYLPVLVLLIGLVCMTVSFFTVKNQLTDAQAQVADLTQQLNAVSNSLSVGSNENANLVDCIAGLTADLDAANEAVVAKQAELDAANALIADQQTKLDGAEAALNEAFEVLNYFNEYFGKPGAEAAAEEVPAEEVPAEEVPAEEVPAEEVPAEEVPAEEVPAEEDPAEEPTAEETPAEEVPAE